jgi:hypothetical protein
MSSKKSCVKNLNAVFDNWCRVVEPDGEEVYGLLESLVQRNVEYYSVAGWKICFFFIEKCHLSADFFGLSV